MAQTAEKRIVLDFEIDFLNGGGLQGRGFRLDIYDEDISDREIGNALIRDLKLLMVEAVRITHKNIVEERHKGGWNIQPTTLTSGTAFHVDLSHTIHDGLITYKGLPAPMICDFLSRNESRKFYEKDTSFHIGKIKMVANTGTYLDSPFHRYESGKDLSDLDLRTLGGLPAVVIRLNGMASRAVNREAFVPFDLGGKAVLIETGWSRYWGTEQYFEGHVFLTRDAAEYLRDQGAALVGIDSYNLDDTSDGERPAHSILLGADIPIVEHLCNLELLPVEGFAFTAVPPKVRGMGTFPVRAFATIGGV